LVIIAALILVGWIAWQTILNLATETRSFLVGLLAGGFLIALSAMTSLILIDPDRQPTGCHDRPAACSHRRSAPHAAGAR
jgi:hypothetical protein